MNKDSRKGVMTRFLMKFVELIRFYKYLNWIEVILADWFTFKEGIVDHSLYL